VGSHYVYVHSMKYSRKFLLIFFAWYLLLVFFFLGHFFGQDLPVVKNVFHYFFVIPYFGFGALFWSLFNGIGIVVITLGLLSSFLFFKHGKWLHFLSHLAVGVIGGLAFGVTGT
jgi:hypothetical protein